MTTHDKDILEAALIGYAQQLALIDAKIAELRSRLGAQEPSEDRTSEGSSKPRKRRKKFSAETRRKMAEAQQRRWAAARQGK